MQKLNSIFLLLTVVLVSMSCTSQELTMKEAYTFLKEYREVKSKEQAETGELITPEIKKYWSKEYNLFGPSAKPNYFIFGDDFKILSIEYVGVELYDEENKKKGRTYFVKILESQKGVMVNNKIDTTDTKEIDFTFWMVQTDMGLKIYGEPLTRNFFILEKNLPILMKRLQQK